MAFGDAEQRQRNARALQDRAREKAREKQRRPIVSSELVPTRERDRRPLGPKIPANVRQAARARSGGRCVVCLFDGKRGQACKKAAHAHHIWPKQRNGWPELAADSRGLVGICFDCHMAHEGASRRIPLAALPPCVFVLAVRTGGRALDYLAGPVYPGVLEDVLPGKLAEATA
jgi:5-methylcytosine-specific restriction endonuclease McrA